ncbi:MAG: cysteine--tRNA ligase, partial [Dehalococcoidia bacterium]|nr:cysteine--tRNA ligase [Dehalococcoidia bacterium]
DELLGVGERERMWRGESMRLMMLSTHYRQPIDFTKRGLDIAKRKLDRWYRCLGETDFDCVADRSDVVNVLCDDINTPKAIAAMDSLCRQVLAGGGLAQDAKHEMLAGASLLGLLRHNTEAWFQGTVLSDLDEEVARIDALIEERDTARKNREFNLADTIRQELLDVGVILEDKSDGKTIWRRDE